MKSTEFTVECEKHAVLPEIALENERVREALLRRDDDAVIAALDEEF